MKAFKTINEDENNDKEESDSADQLDFTNKIFKNSDNIITINGCDMIDFYGILFYHLSSYDKDNC